MTAGYRVMNLEKHPRKAQFEHFSAMRYPYLGVTAEVDITEWLTCMKKKGYPFFLSFLYAAGRAANAVEEMRLRIDGDRVLLYDNCLSSYTVALENGSYCYCNADTSLPFEDYLPFMKKKQEEAIANPSLDDGEEVLSLFFVSSIPWLSFTSLTHPVPDDGDSNPRITWGRYHTVQQRICIPVNVQVNHALCDGLQISRFYEELEKNLKEMCR